MYTITAGKFLSKYCNIQGKELNRLTHEDIIELFDLEACFGCDTSITDIQSGKIILVEDCDGYVMGYINPLLNRSTEECEELFEHPIIIEFYQKLERETGLKKSDIEDLKMYELETLLRNSKHNSDDKTKKLVIKELIKRKEEENNTKEEKLEKVRKRELRKE